ncbi:MAG: cytochrome c [Hyphomicrobiales bacterium]|nr:cytochrome c [Hyphomicrobiales bacterium]
MHKRTVFATVLIATVLFAGVPASAVDVEQVFKFYCAQCHGLNGDGKGPNVSENFPVTPRALTNAEEMNKLTDADIKNVIMDGGPAASKSPMMPPWGKTLSEAQVDELVKHLRKLCACKGKQG